jgi:hypothetical protein
MKNTWQVHVLIELGGLWIFQKLYIYIKTFIDYDHNMKILKIYNYIVEFHQLENIKNLIKVLFSYTKYVVFNSMQWS